MNSWIPSCRDRFTLSDFTFLSSVLSPGGERQHLWMLWEDPEALREMLDLKEVLRALIDSTAALGVSPGFYFYVLVRHSFLEAGITDPGMADYVAGVMVQRLASDTGDPLRSLPTGLTHAADFVAILESAQGRMRFHLQLEAGNQFLVLTGLFPGFITRRCQRRGAPGVPFYEDFARRAYRDAADNRSAPQDAPRRMLGELSEVLPHARLSLNKMAEEFVFLGD
ncbi:hypothetical protein OKA04_06260 [Luteolibacter flavescens]|uniref:Uncharacterized protein n=1 Tax=Luteolibacter flavescens TaxID=1859460 RepID=A0ABT3FL79_9BACT|nr:hypothetical protein [Luteolibacter flavescens]MCW1884327.1 hypothetical protein [Luteolibacter flavescens]